MHNSSIKVSIITIIYNGVAQIEDTILSVINQNYPNFEYIIIDGDSNDGTKNIIKKYDKYITKFVSEPDNGIYDAMNKGIDLANGEWINFMNCGDFFYNESVLNEIFSDIYISNYDIIYGDTCYRYKDFNVIEKPYRNVATIWKNMIFSHQSSFVKSELLLENKFDISYSFAADFKLFFDLYHSDSSFCYIDKIISSNNASDGATLKNHISSVIERKRIVATSTPKLKFLFYYNLILLKLMIYTFIKFILNESILNFILRFKNSFINKGRKVTR